MKSAIQISPVNMDLRKKLDVRSGDTVKVFQKIKEGDKFRTQVFEGLVLARKHGTEAGATFTVRKVASGVGVERVFPLYSPAIEKIEVTRRAKVRRAKLYHIREKAAKEISRQMRREMQTPSSDSAEATSDKSTEASDSAQATSDKTTETK